MQAQICFNMLCAGNHGCKKFNAGRTNIILRCALSTSSLMWVKIWGCNCRFMCNWAGKTENTALTAKVSWQE